MLTDESTEFSAHSVWGEAAAAGPFAVLGDDAVSPGLHFLRVEGMRTLLTPAMLAVGGALADAAAERRFLCVLGDAGVGKTFAVHAAARRLGDGGQLVPLEFRAQPAPADLRTALHRALALPGEAPADPGAADTLIRHALADRPRIVVVEDAHRLSASCMEYLRFLHDGAPGGLCVVLIAARRGERRLRAQRMLATRTAGWLGLQPLTRVQIPLALPALHPVWQGVDPGDLMALDARLAGGALRRWAVITHHTRQVMARAQVAVPDGRLLEAVADRIDGGRCT
ncbi:ATP-binding protein [Streptomyces cellulosae]|uniref:AAA family ATPase n=1 Tax=Streptomyces cellulosae TaxID=1968 RepID=UPI0022546722|nr:ATP-binding protein [Streptomyces cellulosae]MCX4480295.1 ATP-binding protein [Streptomyces cellulosae]MCX4482296.1 ATP-binding protein [Streptomyces cellulosae]WTB86770.1 ATP-binding protein [Streptomyces cellulosae]WTB92856.1 ATP-binding protein [Streptomyces cellulosae]